jgi:hypothetical protein
MKQIRIFYWVGLIVFLALVLPGCSSDGNGGVVIDPNAPAAVSVTSSKPVALADNIDSVEIVAEVKRLDGNAVADGKVVTFATTDPDGSLSAASATTVGGLATVNLTHAPIVVGTNQTTTVTCTAGVVSGSTDVKFITQPASVDVFIAFDQAVTDLAALQFVLNNTAGAAFDNGAQLISAINAAETGSVVAANFNGVDSNNIALINAAGFNTGTLPIIQATYAVSAGLPTFSIDQTPENFIATEPGLGPTTPPVTAANLVVTVTYDTEL